MRTTRRPQGPAARCAAPPRSRSRRRSASGIDPRRGAALLICLLVLTALMLMAIPFAVVTRIEHTASTQALYITAARFGESGALDLARTVLGQGVENEEGERYYVTVDSNVFPFVVDPADPLNPLWMAPIAPADYIVEAGTAAVFPFADPAVDSLWEFEVTLRTQLTPAPLDLVTGLPDWGPMAVPFTAIPGAPILAQITPTEYNVIPADPTLDVLFAVRRAVGFASDGDPSTVDGFIRIDDEWMAYSHVVHLDPTVTGTHFPGALISVLAGNRGLFGSAIAEHLPPAMVSFFPDAALWAATIDDQQARININTAPYRVILNLLGYLGIGDPNNVGNPDVMPGAAAGLFPTPRQELLAEAIVSYKADFSHWEGRDIDGEGAILDGSHTQFQNVNMLRSISLARDYDYDVPPGRASWWTPGVEPSLTADEFDRLVPRITVHSETPGPWGADKEIGSNMAAPAVPPGETGLWAANLGTASDLGTAADIPLWSTVVITKPGTKMRPQYRVVTTRNEPTTLPVGAASGLTTIDLGSVAGYEGATLRTPGYVFIYDTTESEWIGYTGINTGTNQLTGVFSDPFGTPTSGTANDYDLGGTVDGGVITFSYALDPTWAPYAVAGETIVRVQPRHGININTVTDPIVLRSILNGVSDGGADGVLNTVEDLYNVAEPSNGLEASYVAQELLAHMAGEPATSGIYSFYNGNESWFVDTDHTDLNTFLKSLDTKAGSPLEVGDGGPQALDEPALLPLNFSRTPAAWPLVSTVPLRINSGSMVGMDALGLVDDRSETPVAQSRRPGVALARVYDEGTPDADTWEWLSQEDFYVHLITEPAGLGEGARGTHFITNELHQDLAQADLRAHTEGSEFPYTTERSGIGTFGPRPLESGYNLYTTLLSGIHDVPDPVDPTTFPSDATMLDFSIRAATPDMVEVWGTSLDTDNGASQGFTDEGLEYNTFYTAAAGARHIEADNAHAAIEPFAVDLWLNAGPVPPGLGAASPPVRQLVLDLRDGVGDALADTAPNQVQILLETSWDTDMGVARWRLVLEARDQRGGLARGVSSYPTTYPGMPVTGQYGFLFLGGDWHHVAVAAVGTFRDEMAMVIDDVYDRHMEWSYTIDTSTVTEAAAVQGDVWQVATTVPVRKYQVSEGPDAGSAWLNGRSAIGLLATTDLPAEGWVAIGGTADTDIYKYDGFGTLNVNGTVYPTLLLDAPAFLRSPVNMDTPVSVLVPVAHTSHHGPDFVVPTDTAFAGQEFGLWSYTDTGSGSYDQDAPPPAAPVGPCLPARALSVDTSSALTFPFDDASPPAIYYRWLVFSPTAGLVTDPVISGVPGNVLDVSKRWKFFDWDEYEGAGGPVLSGELPSGPIGATLCVGGSRGDPVPDAYLFTGELDEVRVTSLAVAQTDCTFSNTSPETSWQQGQGHSSSSTYTSLPVVSWTHAGGWLGQIPWAQNPRTGASPAYLNPSGGYFLLEGYLYRYSAYTTGTGLITGITPVRDDFTVPVLPGGLQIDHRPLRRLIPLSFITIAKLSVDIDDVMLDIPLDDETEFENGCSEGSVATGYAKIGDEIVGFDQTVAGGGLVGSLGGFHRGCYGTTPDLHNSGTFVRLLPVRYPDKFALPNTAYAAPDLDSYMSMAEFIVNHSAYLKRVWWRFRTPLEDGQRAQVLVRVDGDPLEVTSPLWNEDADSTPRLWSGTNYAGDGGGQFYIYDSSWEYPHVTSTVEVKILLDLSQTSPFNTTPFYGVGAAPSLVDWATGTGVSQAWPVPLGGWRNMVEVDEVGLEMVREPSTY